MIASAKFFKAILILISIVLILTLAGPYVVLAIAKQPTPEVHSYSDSFYTTYDQVRENLARRVGKLRESGIEVVTSEHAINESEGLYIDNIYLPSTQERTNLIVLTTGVRITKTVSSVCATA